MTITPTPTITVTPTIDPTAMAATCPSVNSCEHVAYLQSQSVMDTSRTTGLLSTHEASKLVTDVALNASGDITPDTLPLAINVCNTCDPLNAYGAMPPYTVPTLIVLSRGADTSFEAIPFGKDSTCSDVNCVPDVFFRHDIHDP